MYLKVVYTCGEFFVLNVNLTFIWWQFVVCLVPKKVLKDRFDTPPEPDEPQQNDDHDHDELYDDDQFYKEPEAIPPEQLQKTLQDFVSGKDRLPSDSIPSIITVQSSSVRPPLRNRDESSLEGKLTLLMNERMKCVNHAKPGH